MPILPHNAEQGADVHNVLYPHIGMRKIKSLIAIFVGFCLWQILRLFMPELEVHPVFIYIYGMIEMRESSEKTRDYGRMRILATLTAIAVGIPAMFLTDWLRPMLAESARLWLEIGILILGALMVLCIAEWVKCQLYCGLSASVFVILLIAHFDRAQYLFSLMRAFQTIIGVSIAWVINVKLLPYPAVPGSFSYWIAERIKRKRSGGD